MEVIATFFVCVISGILTGLLGIGGGLIIIPFFLSVIPLFNIHTFSLTQIVAISTTCVFLNSATTVFYRRQEKHFEKSLMVKLAFAITSGTVTGAYITGFLPNKIVYALYIGVCTLSLILFNKKIFIDLKKYNLNFILYLILAFVGATSSMIGIGGAVLFATALKCFIEPDTKVLLPSLTMLVFLHALFAFTSKVILGEVVLYIIPIALLASFIGSKIGIKISQKVNTKTINLMMSFILILGIVRITIELFK